MPAATLARFVLLEARRSGLPWLALACIALSAGLAGFLSEVALTESRALQAAVVAAVLRACAVFLIAAHVASSTLREMNDKGLELMLTLPLSRSVQYLGRLAGFGVLGILVAAAFSAPLLLWAAPSTVALWGLSLACECALVAAATLFFAMTLAQLVPAIAGGPLAEPSFAGEAARWTVNAIAFLLPRLDSVTRTEWLVYAPPAGGAYVATLAGLGLYALLLVAAGLFDFQRKSL